MRLYRLSHWLHGQGLAGGARLVDLVSFVLFHCVLPGSALVGESTQLDHHGLGVVVNKDAVIGSRCIIMPHVVIGGRGEGRTGVPRIGDGCFIGAGAKILGDITIGDGARIGANSVVVDSVPAGATVVGTKAQVKRIVP